MVGRASPLLSRPGTAALTGLLGALVLWEAFAGSAPEVADRWDVAWIAVVLIPLTFGVVWTLAPLADARGLVPVAAATGVLAVLLSLAGLGALFNVAKLVGYALAGFVFLSVFEALSWVVLVSVLVPLVDIGSVYRGPTKVVVEQEPGLFDRISISFRLSGEDDSANIGPPDILFFALFLATAVRFGLRALWTWIAMTALLALTLVATYAFDLNGLPALPALSLGFLLPNADLLLSRWRRQRARRDGQG